MQVLFFMFFLKKIINETKPKIKNKKLKIEYNFFLDNHQLIEKSKKND